ncbi:hypothetical protein [Arthrobacter pigmenti]
MGGSPRDYAQAAAGITALPDDNVERFAGYAVMGLPLSSGCYLAFRHFTASSVGPDYRAVWLRRTNGQWTIYATAPPEQSCARYFGSAVEDAVTTDVVIDWDSPNQARIQVPGIVDWWLKLGTSPTTRAVSAVAPCMPEFLWRNEIVLRAMGMAMGPVLRAGSMNFTGQVPNGQTFQAKPLKVWTIVDSKATIDSKPAGTPLPLPEQERLADFMLPQRGLFVADMGLRFPSTAG